MTKDFKTLVELWDLATREYAQRPLFGSKGSRGFEFMSFGEFRELCQRVRGGLHGLGVGAGDRVAIVSNNRVEWAAAAFATFGLRAAFVPMYEAQPPEEWEFIVNDCGAKVVLAASSAIDDHLRARRSAMPSLKHLVGLHLPASDESSFLALAARGERAPAPLCKPEPDEVASYVYTSGTTGKPKGVLLTHRNFCANVSAVQDLFPATAEDRSLAFLHWAHSFGQTAELYSLFSLGLSMAINDEIKNLVQNMAEVKPTILIAVPRVFNRIYESVNERMQDRPAPIRRLFQRGVALATRRSRGERLSLAERATLALADFLIFRKVRAKVGGKLRVAVCGSAALNQEVAEFIDALGIHVLEGYGLSEASPVVSTNYYQQRKMGSVGKPLPGVRVVIDRTATGDPVSGEIIVYGDNVMKGYHDRPQENAQAFTSDGGLKTGDMGYLDEDGFLFLTGRIKEQYKLETGKYVVPSPLEEQLKLSPFVANVMLFGDNKPHNVALVVVDVLAVERWAKREGHALADVQSDGKVKALIRQELGKYSAKFKSYERPRDVTLVTEDFTVENGLLTPSLKLKRSSVLARYGDALQSLY